MFTTLALLALSGAAQALTIATPPSLVQCQPIKLSWSDGTAPYYLSVIPGGQASAAALVSWPKMEDTSYTWIVNLPADTSITVQVVDGTGTTAFSSPVTVQAGSDDSCMNASSTTSEAATETSEAATSEEAAVSETSEAAAPSSEAEVAPSSAPASTPATTSSAASAPASSSAPAASSLARSSAASSAASAASSAATSAPADSSAGRTVVGSAALAVAGLVALAAF